MYYSSDTKIKKLTIKGWKSFMKKETTKKAHATTPAVETAVEKTVHAAEAAIEKTAQTAAKTKSAAAKTVKTATQTAEKAVKAAEKTVKAAEEAVKNAPVKKTIKELVYLQYLGKEISKDDLMERVKAIWTGELGKKASEIKSITLYLKPEENAAYFVVNGEETGRIDL